MQKNQPNELKLNCHIKLCWFLEVIIFVIVDMNDEMKCNAMKKIYIHKGTLF